jgi:hypothetical protein
MKTNKILLKTMAFAFLGTALIACGDDDPVSLPPIGGYNSADEVGVADLVAYWPLNGSGVESMSSTSPTNTVGATWENGIKGQSAKLSEGYMTYPAISTLSSGLTNFSMSAWVKIQNNGTSASVFLSLTRPNEWAGNINFMAETGWKDATVDSLAFKGLIVSDNAIGWQDSRNTIKLDQGMMDENSSNPTEIQHTAFPNKVGGQWAHAVITWDGATRLFKVYSNGVKISNPKWEQRGTPDGTLIAFTSPTTPIIGAFGDIATTTEPWNKAMTGNIDEVRVWKKTLNDADINSLYELELAGR